MEQNPIFLSTSTNNKQYQNSQKDNSKKNNNNSKQNNNNNNNKNKEKKMPAIVTTTTTTTTRITDVLTWKYQDSDVSAKVGDIVHDDVHGNGTLIGWGNNNGDLKITFSNGEGTKDRTCGHVKPRDFTMMPSDMSGVDIIDLIKEDKDLNMSDSDDDEPEDEDAGQAIANKLMKASVALEHATFAPFMANKQKIITKLPQGMMVSQKMDGNRKYWNGGNLLYSFRSLKTHSLPPNMVNQMKHLPPFEMEVIVDPADDGPKNREAAAGYIRKGTWSRLQFVMFDLPTSDKVYRERLADMKRLNLPPFIKVVKSWGKVQDPTTVNNILGEVCNGGGEGLMLNVPDATYQYCERNKKGKRPLSKNIFKLKPCIDMEAKIIGNSGNNGHGVICEDNQGRRFYAGTKKGYNQPDRIVTIHHQGERTIISKEYDVSYENCSIQGWYNGGRTWANICNGDVSSSKKQTGSSSSSLGSLSNDKVVFPWKIPDLGLHEGKPFTNEYIEVLTASIWNKARKKIREEMKKLNVDGLHLNNAVSYFASSEYNKRVKTGKKILFCLRQYAKGQYITKNIVKELFGSEAISPQAFVDVFLKKLKCADQVSERSIRSLIHSDKIVPMDFINSIKRPFNLIQYVCRLIAKHKVDEKKPGFFDYLDDNGEFKNAFDFEGGTHFHAYWHYYNGNGDVAADAGPADEVGGRYQHVVVIRVAALMFCRLNSSSSDATILNRLTEELQAAMIANDTKQMVQILLAVYKQNFKYNVMKSSFLSDMKKIKAMNEAVVANLKKNNNIVMLQKFRRAIIRQAKKRNWKKDGNAITYYCDSDARVGQEKPGVTQEESIFGIDTSKQKYGDGADLMVLIEILKHEMIHGLLVLKDRVMDDNRELHPKYPSNESHNKYFVELTFRLFRHQSITCRINHHNKCKGDNVKER